MTDAQRRLLNAIATDLSKQLVWHGLRLSKDDFRHLVAGTVLGWRMMPGIDRGEGERGFIMLGGSSMNLSKAEAAEAITLLIHLGDDPASQGLNQKPVRWSEKVLCGMGYSLEDLRRDAA